MRRRHRDRRLVLHSRLCLLVDGAVPAHPRQGRMQPLAAPTSPRLSRPIARVRIWPTSSPLGRDRAAPDQVLGLSWADYNRDCPHHRQIVRVKGKDLVRVIKEGRPQEPSGLHCPAPSSTVKILDRRWQRMQLRKKQNPPPVGSKVDLIFRRSSGPRAIRSMSTISGSGARSPGPARRDHALHVP